MGPSGASALSWNRCLVCADSVDGFRWLGDWWARFPIELGMTQGEAIGEI